MTAIHAWFTDKDGYFAGEIDSPNSNDDWDTFAANAQANGHTVIPKGSDPVASRPQDRPLSAAQLALREKAARLDALRAKGHANLTAEERDEAAVLLFDLGR